VGILDKLRKVFSTGKAEGEEQVAASQYTKTEEDKKERVSTLTQRELETCQLLLEGYTLKETSKQLGIKYSTVNTYMTSLYRKLGVNSRAELIICYKDIEVNESEK
jgi:DNA-binding CsgD family transcriptional regulator